MYSILYDGLRKIRELLREGCEIYIKKLNNTLFNSSDKNHLSNSKMKDL